MPSLTNHPFVGYIWYYICAHPLSSFFLSIYQPDNVGFDKHGTVKLFDFGFAREEHTIEPNEIAGSLRYMAPEVAGGHGSLLSSDVYSFGVLFWEICTLEKPYKHINSREEFIESVVVDEWRHTTSKIPSATLCGLINQCWQSDPLARPSFSQVVKKLRVEVAMTTTPPGAASTATTIPNKGFGSSDNLKRTATWTAKTLTSGISQSTLGVIRMGFRNSKESLSTLEQAASLSGSTANNSTTVESRTTRNPQARMGWASRSRSYGRSKSPINGLFGHAAERRGSRLANATFGSSSSSAAAAAAGRSLLLLGEQSSSSMTGMTTNTAHHHHEDQADTTSSSNDIHTSTTSTSTSGLVNTSSNPVSLRRGLPSAPGVIGRHA